MYEHDKDSQLKELTREEMEEVQGGLGYPDIGPWGVTDGGQSGAEFRPPRVSDLIGGDNHPMQDL